MDTRKEGAPGRKFLSIIFRGADCWNLLSKTMDNSKPSVGEPLYGFVTPRVEFCQNYTSIVFLEDMRWPAYLYCYNPGL